MIIYRATILPHRNKWSPLINDGRKNRLGHLRWGLIPPWAKDEKIGYKMINARAETVSEKPSYRNAFKKKRCIIPADSFYEWQNTEDGKVPDAY